jgi:hypothetical protein
VVVEVVVAVVSNSRSVGGRPAQLRGAVVPNSSFPRIIEVEASDGEALLAGALDALASAALVVE